MAEKEKTQEEQVLGKLKKIICDVTSKNPDPVLEDEVTPEKLLRDDLGLSHIEYLGLMLGIEKMIDHHMTNDMEEPRTVQDCMDYILTHS